MVPFKEYLLAFFLAVAGSTAAWADATIKVSLWDKFSASTEMEEALLQSGGQLDAAVLPGAMMGITLDQQSVASGKITFKTSNDSREMYHEIVIAPLPEGTTELAYDAAEGRVIEAAVGAIGEGLELGPRTRGEITLELPAGSYVVFCNLSGHFASGMWTLLTVTP